MVMDVQSNTLIRVSEMHKDSMEGKKAESCTFWGKSGFGGEK